MILRRDGVVCDAVFSEDRRHRYTLTRRWDVGRGWLNVVALNPSTATETDDDPTIRRCMGFARRWGYGGLLMTNIFAWRSTDPKGLQLTDDPVGPANDVYLRHSARYSSRTVCAWGVHGALLERGHRVRLMLMAERPLYVFGLTSGGHPKHPLYLPNSTEPVPWAL